MKWRGVIFIVFFFVSVNLIAQNNLRDIVVIVRPVYSNSTTSFLRDLAISMRKDKLNNSKADLIDSYINGGFGTGFVVYNNINEKFYILTNSHVISQAKYVNIEFIKSGNEKDSIEKCNIVAVDPDLDLAIIELPEDIRFESSLTFYNGKIKDGQNVFSAGFPGLGSEPSWQLGKGIISNSEIFLEELVKTEKTHLIQHTAQIDPGSSGGPLLIHNENLPLKYEVIGINTWKARNREGVNIAIPSSAIIGFINSYPGNYELTESSLKNAVESILNLYTDKNDTDYEKILPYISCDYLSNISVDDFYEMQNVSSDKAKKANNKNFADGNPVEALKITIADAVSKFLNGKTVKFLKIENFNTKGDPVTVWLEQNGKNISSIWVAEHGYWKVANLSIVKVNQLKNGLIDRSFSNISGVKLGIGFPLNERVGTVYNVNLSASFLYYSVGIDLRFGKINPLFPTVPFYFVNPDTEYEYIKKSMIGIDLEWGLQIPLKTSLVTIIPFCRAVGGLTVINEKEKDNYYALDGGFNAGLEFAYKLSRKTYLLLGASYKKKYYMQEDEIKIKPTSNLEVYIGIFF